MFLFFGLFVLLLFFPRGFQQLQEQCICSTGFVFVWLCFAFVFSDFVCVVFWLRCVSLCFHIFSCCLFLPVINILWQTDISLDMACFWGVRGSWNTVLHRYTLSSSHSMSPVCFHVVSQKIDAGFSNFFWNHRHVVRAGYGYTQIYRWMYLDKWHPTAQVQEG